MFKAYRSRTPLPLFFIAALFLFGCGSGADQQEKEGMKEEEKKEEKKGDAKNDEEADRKDPVLPSTLQVASSFKQAGLPYKDGLILDPGKAGDLMESDRKKLAFGAYSADLAYLVLNEEEEKALKTMKALMDLSDELNISSIFDADGISKRFRSNLENQDSLVSLIIEVQEQFDAYVAKNRSRELRTIAYAGGWSEAMHLAANAEPKDQKELHLEVEEQMTVLDKLLIALERDLDKSEGPLADLLTILKRMNRNYEEKAPEPGEALPGSLMDELVKDAAKARRIIANENS